MNRETYIYDRTGISASHVNTILFIQLLLCGLVVWRMVIPFQAVIDSLITLTDKARS